MILAYFEELARGIEEKIARDPSGPVARKRFALELARLGVRLFSGRERVAWCGVLAPFDLLGAMGVTSCFTEFVGAMLASSGGVVPLLEAAEEAGWSPDSCSYHRSVLGAMRRGLMPAPAFLVATTAPCTGGLAVIETLAAQLGKDLFLLHVPQGSLEEGARHVVEQLERLVRFVEERTGQGLDRERLADAVRKANEARALLVETYELASRVPTPARRRDLINVGLVINLLLGDRAAVDVARAYRDEFAATARAQAAASPRRERLRLLWLQNRIQFKNPLEQALEELGAAVVVDEWNDITWDPIDPDDPLPGMARRLLSTTLVGPVSRRIENLRRLARLYAVDGAINPCHFGCRQGTGARGLVEEGLREIGVPVLNLEVDCVDPRNFSEGQLRTRLEAFVEMLAAR
jgi:benzoyl-CoA reductase/2-hydroxyglutaryl-CoA dehydratase subunit BcrC/BadD/HgdB